MSKMKLVSLNVGKPQEVQWKGRTVRTGIFKEPVSGRIAVRTMNLDGDGQADRSVHGGSEKAVYLYPSEHYPFWREEFPGKELPWGMFGENLTTEGILENDVNIGDRFRMGSAELIAVQPRMPCYKLGIRFGRSDILKRFMASGRSGIYFAVLKEGEVEPGDTIELIHRDVNQVTISDVARLLGNDRDDIKAMRRVVGVEALPENLRAYFFQKIRNHSG
jgi:MOSC domain-containing protein YiiM